MARKIQVKRGTAANMPVLADGELGLQTDTGKLFIGCSGVNVPIGMSDELLAHTGDRGNPHGVTKAQVGLSSVENQTPDQIRRGGGKHLAGQGSGGGYSFTGDSGEDTGMFSDSDGELYFMKNGQRWNSQDFFTPDGSKSVNYANSANYANGAGNADTVDGFHISAGTGDIGVGAGLAHNQIYLVYE